MKKLKSNGATVAIIMGSKSDLPMMKGAKKIIKQFGISSEVTIVSSHRTPEFMQEFAKKASKRNIEVIIAGAGGAAHLPVMVASLTTLPVIGVPVGQGVLKGLDALFSIVQMPRGVPVATMAINNSENAGLLAVRILALGNARLQSKLSKFNKSQTNKVMSINRKMKARR